MLSMGAIAKERNEADIQHLERMSPSAYSKLSARSLAQPRLNSLQKQPSLRRIFREISSLRTCVMLRGLVEFLYLYIQRIEDIYR